MVYSNVKVGDKVKIMHIMNEDRSPTWKTSYKGEVVGLEKRESGRVSNIEVKKESGELKEEAIGSTTDFEVIS